MANSSLVALGANLDVAIRTMTSGRGDWLYRICVLFARMMNFVLIYQSCSINQGDLRVCSPRIALLAHQLHRLIVELERHLTFAQQWADAASRSSLSKQPRISVRV